MPPDGLIKGLEVYIGKLTTTQLSYLFELLCSNQCESLDNVLFWKVTFPNSSSCQLLASMTEQASLKVRRMQTLMVYCCEFQEEAAR